MSFVVLNCQVVEWVDVFANPVFKNPAIYTALWRLFDAIFKKNPVECSFRDLQNALNLDSLKCF